MSEWQRYHLPDASRRWVQVGRTENCDHFVIFGRGRCDLTRLPFSLYFNYTREQPMNRTKVIAAIMAIAVTGFVTTNAVAKDRTTGRNTGPIVYVESQGLFYDSIVLADLPSNGRFQELKPGEGPSGLATEFGPGNTGYLGGRWWIDANMNGYMDDDDAYFLCPLLGPGRSTL